MSEYSQGICHDGAAILKDGEMMTVDDVVAELSRVAELEAKLMLSEGRAEVLERMIDDAIDWIQNDCPWSKEDIRKELER